jgi:hypothetical protein
LAKRGDFRGQRMKAFRDCFAVNPAHKIVLLIASAGAQSALAQGLVNQLADRVAHALLLVGGQREYLAPVIHKKLGGVGQI